MDPCPPVPGWSDVVRANVALTSLKPSGKALNVTVVLLLFIQTLTDFLCQDHNLVMALLWNPISASKRKI